MIDVFGKLGASLFLISILITSPSVFTSFSEQPKRNTEIIIYRNFTNQILKLKPRFKKTNYSLVKRIFYILISTGFKDKASFKIFVNQEK